MWNYYRDEVNEFANENNYANNCRIYNNKTTTTIKSSKYKASTLIGSTSNNNSRLAAKIVVPLK